MYQSLIILDDVLDNAAEIRRAALSLDYPTKSTMDLFPGRNSARRIRIKLLEDLAMRMTGERLIPTCDNYGLCRIALEGDHGRGGVHVDDCHWSGIYYLSEDADCVGGTDFYRHRETGAEHAPYRKEHLKRWGVESYEAFTQNISGPQAKDPSKWEHLMQVPMKFNRLVLFRPWLWHNAGPGFGSDMETGRLIHTLFFNNADKLAA